jgi:hypothetical protein
VLKRKLNCLFVSETIFSVAGTSLCKLSQIRFTNRLSIMSAETTLSLSLSLYKLYKKLFPTGEFFSPFHMVKHLKRSWIFHCAPYLNITLKFFTAVKIQVKIFTLKLEVASPPKRWYPTENYEGVSKSFRTGRLERELKMVQLSVTRWSCIAILWVSLVNFAAITLYVAFQLCLLLLLFISLSTQSGNFWIQPRILM